LVNDVDRIVVAQIFGQKFENVTIVNCQFNGLKIGIGVLQLE
jgi:hypothetical protein